MGKSRGIRFENIDDEDRSLISEMLDEAHLVTGKNGLTRKEKQISEIIDSLEAIDDDDLAAIAAAENGSFSEPIDTLTEPDPVGGVDVEPIDVAAQDIPSEFEESPMDLNEIEDYSDAILEQSNDRLKTIIRSLEDIW